MLTWQNRWYMRCGLYAIYTRLPIYVLVKIQEGMFYYGVNSIFYIDNITRSTLWSKAPENTERNDSSHWRNLLPPKRIQKICAHHQPNIRRYLRRHSVRQPPKTNQKFEHQTTRTTPCRTAPPKTNPKNLQTLTPRLEVRTPMAQAIWGKTSLFDLFSWFLCKIYPAKITASDLLMFVGGTSNRFFWGPRKGWFKATRS